MKLETKEVKPVSGKYTFYVDRSDRGAEKRARLSRLFPGKYPFFQSNAEQAHNEAKGYFQIMRTEIIDVSAIDPALGVVDLTYQNRTGTTTPPGETLPDEVFAAPGGPMNRYVPNLQSPGASGTDAVRVEGTDMTENPRLTPEEVVGNVQVQDNPNLAQPANQDTRVKA